MKKQGLLLFLLLLVGIAGAAAAWLFLGLDTGLTEKKKALYIRSTAATKEAVLDSIQTEHLVSHPQLFEWR